MEAELEGGRFDHILGFDIGEVIIYLLSMQPDFGPVPDNGSPARKGTSAWQFWCVFMMPIVVGVCVELFSGLDWSYRSGLNGAILVLLIILGCSSLCAVWIAFRFFGNSALRVFIVSGLVLAFTAGYLMFMVILHYVGAVFEPM